jgi:glycosyltransferase involved in cell wall biosynthesis
MKVALVYDRVNKWGGAERVLLLLQELFPDAPLYTSVYHPSKASWAKSFTVKTSFLQYFPFAKSSHELYAPLMPLAFESFSFDEYDLVISVTSESAKGIMTKPHTKHICLCLTPTRYLWSGHDTYFQNSFLRFLAEPIIRYLRKWDTLAAQRPDTYIAISQEVQKRIKKYYGRESKLIYPPVTLSPKAMQIVRGLPRSLSVARNDKDVGGFFLIVSRLVSAKRIDLAIEACNKLTLPLKIIGAGSDVKRLKKRAGPTISFLGNLTDSEVVRYYKACSALIFPGIEDFGLTVLEAQLFGKPVIAYQSGGALETIIAGKTGEFFSPQTAEALINTLSQLIKSGKISLTTSEQAYYKDACIQQAGKFTKEIFNQEMKKYIKNL